jgi:hypothetical protein
MPSSNGKHENGAPAKPSVKEEIREIREAKKLREAETLRSNERAETGKRGPSPHTLHAQPPGGGRKKPSKSKGGR